MIKEEKKVKKIKILYIRNTERKAIMEKERGGGGRGDTVTERERKEQKC